MSTETKDLIATDLEQEPVKRRDFLKVLGVGGELGRAAVQDLVLALDVLGARANGLRDREAVVEFGVAHLEDVVDLQDVDRHARGIILTAKGCDFCHGYRLAPIRQLGRGGRTGGTGRNCTARGH